MKSISRGQWKIVIPILCALLILISAGSALAQTVGSPAPHAQPQVQGPDRSGFTLLLTMGVGFQKVDSSDLETGLGGLNLGIGGFLSPDLALMFRVSGTNVQYGRSDIVSGFGGPAVQYWANDSLNLEGGLGMGFANSSRGYDDRGFGMLLGVGYSFFHRNKTSLQFGFEYAPVFIESTTIHNIGITFGWQLL